MHDRDVNDPNDLPFCGPNCAGCAAEEAAVRAIDAATGCSVHGPYTETDWQGRPTCRPCDDDMARREHLLEMQAERAWSEGSQGFYWGGGEREDRFYFNPNAR